MTQLGKASWLAVSLTCDLARSSKCRHTCFASRSGQLSRGYNWRIWPTPRDRTEHNTRINTLVWQGWQFVCFIFLFLFFFYIRLGHVFFFFFFFGENRYRLVQSKWSLNASYTGGTLARFFLVGYIFSFFLSWRGGGNLHLWRK